MVKYYVTRELSSISRGYNTFEVDADTGEVKDLENHPKIAAELLAEKLVTERQSQPAKRRRRKVEKEIKDNSDSGNPPDDATHSVNFLAESEED